MITGISSTPFADYSPSTLAGTDEDIRGKEFEKVLRQLTRESLGEKKEESGKDVSKNERARQLEEAAKQMEIQMVTMMFKTMEKSSSENGILGGGKSAGMAHFKDMFFYQVAEQVVDQQGLGFAQSLLSDYKAK